MNPETNNLHALALRVVLLLNHSRVIFRDGPCRGQGQLGNALKDVQHTEMADAIAFTSQNFFKSMGDNRVQVMY